MELLVAFITAVVTGFIGSALGGGGLLLIPILIMLGLKADVAVATATFGYVGVSLMGLYQFKKSKKFDEKIARATTTSLTIGSVIGALMLPWLDLSFLNTLIGASIIIIAIVSLIDLNSGLSKRKVSNTQRSLGHFFYMLAGIHKNLAGAGTGIIGTYIHIYFFGQSYLESSGTRRLPFLVSHAISAIIFAYLGLIHWPIGIALLAGNLIGSNEGAIFIIRKGEKWMKIGFTIIVIISALKILIG